MSRYSTFEDEVQFVNYVLNQKGDHRHIDRLDPLDEDTFTAYVSQSFKNCMNYVYGRYDWNFAKETTNLEETAEVAHRAKSVWEFPAMTEYNHICKIELRDDLLSRYRECFHWWVLKNGRIATNFDKTNVLHLDTAVVAEFVSFTDIIAWSPSFCNLVANALKQLLVEENTQDMSEYKFHIQLDEVLLREAMREDDLLDNSELTIKRY